VQTPEANAAAVFEHAFGREVAVAARHGRTRQLCKSGVANAVLVHDAVFGTLLVIQHEIERDSRSARPARIRRIAAIADKIAFKRERNQRLAPDKRWLVRTAAPDG